MQPETPSSLEVYHALIEEYRQPDMVRAALSSVGYRSPDATPTLDSTTNPEE